jgi:hypothetical protein
VRDGLVADPLCWPWSTLRDGLGVIADPWVGPDRVQAQLGFLPKRLHHYVASDDACDILARRPLHAFRPGEDIVTNLSALAKACASAHRRPVTDIRRRASPMRPTFVALASRYTRPKPAQLAEYCEVSPRVIADLHQRAQPHAIRAAALCLAEPRLRVWTTPPLDRRPFRLAV